MISLNRVFVLIIILIFTFACEEKKETPKNTVNIVNLDLDKIKKRGKLIAITGYNAYSYFIYRGRPMGYEYELVNRLAEHLNVSVEFIIEKDLGKMFEMLDNGEGDLIAFNLTVTKKRKQRVNFTSYHNTTRQVLVQRKPENWRKMKSHQIEKELLRSPIDLEGKTVFVRHSSAYLNRMENLEDEIGGDIIIKEAGPDVSTEDLIEMVADGTIEYTVSDKNIAMLNQAYYTNLDIRTDISLPQKIAWAVRKNAPMLLTAINSWLDELKKQPDYYVIHNKYYSNRNAFRNRMTTDFYLHKGGKISEYDDELKEYSEQLGWDWRMLASLIFQESRFDPEAKSWAGAVGLMQLMPQTAGQYGVKNLEDPEQNLKAGIKYLQWLDNYWKKEIENKQERLKFVLASYNIGLGHIIDARRLAEKYGADPNIWFKNVELYLLKKSNSKYYNDEVVRNGYAKGTETIRYVEEILERFSQYKQFIS